MREYVQRRRSERERERAKRRQESESKCADKCFYWVKMDECCRCSCCYCRLYLCVCVCVRVFFLPTARLTVINYWSFRHFRISPRLFSTSLSISVQMMLLYKRAICFALPGFSFLFLFYSVLIGLPSSLSLSHSAILFVLFCFVL